MQKEGRKKQARSYKQQSKATQHTQGSHFSKGKMSCLDLGWDSTHICMYKYTLSLTPRTGRALSPRGEREIDLLPEEQCSQCPLRAAGVAEVAVQPATLGPGPAPQHQLHHLQSRVRETPGKEGTCFLNER